MRVRIVASGIAIAALAGAVVPVALSGPASAIAATGAPTITTCSPSPAIMGKAVTIHGTGLAGATKVTIDGKTVTATKDAAKAITAPVPAAVKTSSNVKVVTAKGSATAVCKFQKAKKHKK